MTEFTKGNWEVYKDELTKDTYTVDVKHTGHEKVYQEIAVVFGKDNANLISAAPDMFEALVRTCEDLESWFGFNSEEGLKSPSASLNRSHYLMKTSLKKARGES